MLADQAGELVVLLIGISVRRHTATSVTALSSNCQIRSAGGKHKIEVLGGGEVGLEEVRSGVGRVQAMYEYLPSGR